MNDKLAKLWNNPKRTPVLIGFIAFNAGFTLGYILANVQKAKSYELSEKSFAFNPSELDKARAERQRNSAPSVPSAPRPRVTEQPSSIVRSPETSSVVIDGEHFAVGKLKETIVTQEDIEEPLELVTQSIFDNKNDDWDYDKEVKKRSPDTPYIIHKDEFYSEESGLTQVTLTYYAGDNIMCDEDDSPIYNHEQVTGPLLFGHGSGDPNVVHIRNEKRKAEYEVLYDPGLYSVDVLGLQIEDNQRVKDIKHSNQLHKFKLD